MKFINNNYNNLTMVSRYKFDFLFIPSSDIFLINWRLFSCISLYNFLTAKTFSVF